MECRPISTCQEFQDQSCQDDLRRRQASEFWQYGLQHVTMHQQALRLRRRARPYRSGPESCEESEAGGVEHGGLGVDGLAEVLGADAGMVTTVFGNGTVHVQAVGGDEAADIVGGEEENALEAILLLGLQGEAALRVRGGYHRSRRCPKGHEWRWCWRSWDRSLCRTWRWRSPGPHRRRGAGRRWHRRPWRRVAGKELDGSLTEDVFEALGGFPTVAGAGAGSKGAFDPIHVVEGLGFEGGGNGDDAAAHTGIAEEQPGKEMGLELVLAGLARQDNDEGEAAMVDDGVLDGAGDPALVGAKVDAASTGPGDGAATDGGTDEGGEGRHDYSFPR